jgi:hypothetical protein
VYGDEFLSHSCVSELFKLFEDGHEDLRDDPRSGRPSTSQNADAVTNAREMVIRDCRLMMANELYINEETICRILPKFLWKRKICAKFTRLG